MNAQKRQMLVKHHKQGMDKAEAIVKEYALRPETDFTELVIKSAKKDFNYHADEWGYHSWKLSQVQS